MQLTSAHAAACSALRIKPACSAFATELDDSLNTIFTFVAPESRKFCV